MTLAAWPGIALSQECNVPAVSIIWARHRFNYLWICEADLTSCTGTVCWSFVSFADSSHPLPHWTTHAQCWESGHSSGPKAVDKCLSIGLATQSVSDLILFCVTRADNIIVVRLEVFYCSWCVWILLVPINSDSASSPRAGWYHYILLRRSHGFLSRTQGETGYASNQGMGEWLTYSQSALCHGLLAAQKGIPPLISCFVLSVCTSSGLLPASVMPRIVFLPSEISVLDACIVYFAFRTG